MVRSEHAHPRVGATTASSVAPWLVLGLLIEQPSHGYEIKQRYEDRFFSWLPTSGSSIYGALDRLREEGLAETVEVEPSRARRPRERMRHHHRATAAGVRAYREWVSELMAEGFQRSELLAGIARWGMLDLPGFLRIVDSYAGQCLQELRDSPLANLDRLADCSAEDVSELLVRERHRRELQAQLDWATWVRRVVRKYAQEKQRES